MKKFTDRVAEREYKYDLAKLADACEAEKTPENKNADKSDNDVATQCRQAQVGVLVKSLLERLGVNTNSETKEANMPVFSESDLQWAYQETGMPYEKAEREVEKFKAKVEKVLDREMSKTRLR